VIPAIIDSGKRSTSRTSRLRLFDSVSMKQLMERLSEFAKRTKS
jgi:hypothetical protein